MDRLHPAESMIEYNTCFTIKKCTINRSITVRHDSIIYNIRLSKNRVLYARRIKQLRSSSSYKMIWVNSTLVLRAKKIRHKGWSPFYWSPFYIVNDQCTTDGWKKEQHVLMWCKKNVLSIDETVDLRIRLNKKSSMTMDRPRFKKLKMIKINSIRSWKEQLGKTEYIIAYTH